MSNAPNAHPWLLLAPWWHWQPADDPQAGRGTAPLLQMFAADDFIESYLQRPQHSLRFKPDVDTVGSVTRLGAPLPAAVARAQAAQSWLSGGGDALRTQALPVSALQEDPRNVRLVASGLRKLYLPLHGRHYLVSCSLHCDERGLPAVDPAQVCSAGFVIRRLSAPVPRALERELYTLQQRREQAAAELDELQLRGPLREHLAWARRRRLQTLEARGELAAALAAAQQAHAAAEAALATWRVQHGITQRVEYWVADPLDPERGRWQDLPAEQQLAGPPDEQFFPLRRLVAPPNEPTHDATGRTLYHGHVPTSSAQRDAEGRPRLDMHALYEIRCFVTRRRSGCTRPRGAAGCQGQRVWSLATEAFRIASPMDAVGCANRPVTLRMPDLNELLAQALARPRGTLSNVRVVHSQQIAPKVVGGQPQPGAAGGGAICHLSIPLITIIAMFVLNIFLPVVVLLFNLWFLLAFRFCIPPSVSASGDIDAAAKITPLLPPSADFSAGVTVDGNFLDAGEVRDALRAGLKAQVEGDSGLDGDGRAAIDALPDVRLATDTRNSMDNRSLLPVATDDSGRLLEPRMPSEVGPVPADFLDHPVPQTPRPRGPQRSTA
jgi:hypothetical protein